MAGIRDDELITFDGFPLGINNRAPEESAPLNALRAAKNIDLDDVGTPRRRPGAELAAAAPGMHSLWAHDRFPYMLAVFDGDIVLVDTTEDLEPLGLTLARPEAPMSWDFVAGAVYASNGVDAWQILPTGAVRPWAAECPGGQPLVTPQVGQGGLAPGTYQTAVTFIDQDGRESGATLPVEADVVAGGGLLLTNFPVAVDPRTALMRVYCSPPNVGEVLYAVQDLPVGMPSFLIGAHVPGAALDKLFLSPMPAGNIVRAKDGRLYVAQGPMLLWSEALNYGLTVRHRYQSRHDADITMIAPAGQAEGSGLFVATAAGNGKRAGRTYYLTGTNPKDWQRVVAYPHGAVPGSLTELDAKALGLQVAGLVPVWLSDHGQFVIGTPGGGVMELHAERYVAPAHAERASIALREFGGLRHLVATLRGGQVSGLAAVDIAIAEVWKDGARIS